MRKAAPDDILMRITVAQSRRRSRGAGFAAADLVPQHLELGGRQRAAAAHQDRPGLRSAEHATTLGKYYLYADGMPADILFCDNETNTAKLWTHRRRRVTGRTAVEIVWSTAIRKESTRSCREPRRPVGILSRSLRADGREVRLRLTKQQRASHSRTSTRSSNCAAPKRMRFTRTCKTASTSADARSVQRQAFAGMIWSKQFLLLRHPALARGDPAQPAPPAQRLAGRNRDWGHLNNADVISMPDKWEYPWYAAWDLAFHCIPLADDRPGFAKRPAHAADP